MIWQHRVYNPYISKEISAFYLSISKYILYAIVHHITLYAIFYILVYDKVKLSLSVIEDIVHY